jgi:serine protease AprX
MSKAFKILILVLIIGGIVFGLGLFSHIFQGEAQETKPLAVEEKKIPKIIDKDKNKIFDNLEEILEGQPDETPFDVILLFEENLSDALFENIKGKIGDFPIRFQYPSISGIATNLTKGQIKALSKIPLVKQIEDDAMAEIFLDKATYWFGVQKARTDFGVDGNLDGATSTYTKDDIVIAVLDTGIDYNHVDLDGGKVIAQKCYCCTLYVGGKCIKPCCPNGLDEDVNAMDDHGHGTHVSSIAAGEGQANSLYKGVAPYAALVGIKVLSNKGEGLVSYVNKGIQWVIDNKITYGIEVMNMSLGIAGSSDGTDSTSLLINQAVDAGIVAVVAAGNEGPTKYTIGSPAAAAKAITVGAMADVQPGTAASLSCGNAPGYGFYQACFSSRGPTADGRIKPDISAPGVFIVAAKAGTVSDYVQYSGTSMSSPFVAGLAGLILQANLSLTPAQIKSKIAATAIDWDASGGGTGGLTAGSDIDYGAGRLDGYEAVKSAGGFTGINIATPEHKYFTGSLIGTGDFDWYDINVTTTSYPIAVTLIMPDWISSTNPDFDIALYLSDGTTKLTESISATRQETIGYQPTATGIYKLKVYSYSGSGNYFFDLSAGTAPVVSISLTTDGTTPFGILPLNTTIDTTPAGTNDVQTVRVDTGPAKLDIRTTLFSDGTNNWTLGSANGDNQVVWEYSKEGTTWNKFLAANNLYLFDSNVPQSETRNLYLKLTMPTATVSSAQYSSTVTIVATAP